MSVLGHAIAGHLARLGGLYSVELPETLAAEMHELVISANAQQSNRALLVTDDVPPASVAATAWRDVLKWRTSDDRIFTWKRGHREPDTSFRSVVRPFISSRFPGAGGGECTLAQLVRLCIAELWVRRRRKPVGDSFDAFERTGQWVAGVLRQMFEEAGSTPSVHWSDRFLEHWSRMLSDLDSNLATFGVAPDPRHAWEVVRVSGLPLPSKIAQGNPFLEPPAELDPKEWPRLAELWDDIVQSFVIPEGGISILLTALDRQVVGAVKTSPWRMLPWNLALAMPAGMPAPAAGRVIFSDPTSPTLLTQTVPQYPIAPVPAWWGVSSEDLEQARKRLRQQTPLVPDDACTGVIRLVPGKQLSPYVLNVRAGTLTQAHTPKKWRVRILVRDVRLLFKEDWSALHVSPLQPNSAQDGDAWINPDTIDVSVKGAKVESTLAVRDPIDRLLITLEVLVEFAAAKDAQSGAVTGSSNPARNLRVMLRVHRWGSSQWDVGRTVDAEVELILPSPHSPTVLVTDTGKLYLAPDNQDKYEANVAGTASWMPESTPTILLKEEGPYDVHVYDGTVSPTGAQFAALAQPTVGASSMGAPTGAMFPAQRSNLDDGVLVGNTVGGAPTDTAVFRVRERSANLSSGLLSAVRGLPAGRKQPSSNARNSVLGQYQGSVTRALCSVGGGLPNSLIQYVISSTDELAEWRAHVGTPSPMFLFAMPVRFTLPGVGNGPSSRLVQTAEWQAFMQTTKAVSTALGLMPGSEGAWLSGLDFSAVDGILVRRYVDAHRALVQIAKTLEPSDAFWASYPFSILVVEGKQGVSFGQLLAVLLSPLHPARFAWTFAVTVIAKSVSSGDAVNSTLLQLAEGWNVPCTGAAINSAGQHRQLVSVPTDPGLEQDFASWSALAVLSDNNLADLPVMAAGQSLPWGGRTGINAKVVERAIKDYLLVHPHLNSLEVDVRSVAPAPRAQEIDEALLELVAAENLQEVGQLGGGARVWDCVDRHGATPTRDRLFAVRGNAEPTRPFEWRSYEAADPPAETDVALVENASVHLGVVEGGANGVLGLIPLRRFSPADLQGLRLDQNFLPRPGEDVLGLADLLRAIESPPHLHQPALRATPHAHALGIGRNARWEVLGTFNLDPALLSAVIAASSQGNGKRLLWEWRPSWMPVERKVSDLARRPYYVVARIPASLLKALQSRQGFSLDDAAELLEVLGHRGIGLAALSAEAGTQESAASGFFYAMQLFLPPPSLTAQLPGPNLAGRVLGVIPIDSIESILQGLAGKKLERRADLLAIAMSVRADGTVRLCFVPVEAKHHGMPSHPEPIPMPNDRELVRARQQLTQTAALLHGIADTLTVPLTKDEVAATCLKRLALATLVDLALSFAPVKPAPAFRGQMLRGILSGQLEIGLGDPILLWFAPGSAQSSGGPCVVDRYASTQVDQVRIREVFIDPSTIPGLWWSGKVVGMNETQVRTAVNTVVETAFAACTSSTSQGSSTELEQLLRELLGLPKDDRNAEGVSTPPATSATVDLPKAPASGATPLLADVGTTARDGSDDNASTPSVVNTTARQQLDAAAARPPTPEVGLVAPQVTETPEPRAIVGWSSTASRWAVVGKLAGSDEPIALDLDHPKTVGIFGYMGSGKSYLLGNLIESAVEELPGINKLQVPLAVVVFNYRRNASDRFELSSLAFGNQNPADVERLSLEYGAAPAAIRDLHVLCLPGELRPERQREYGSLSATELYFDPRSLGAEDWELLMGEPGSEAVFARTIRNTLVDLRSSGDITLENLEHEVTTRLTGQSRTAAKLRFDFVRRYTSEPRGVDFGALLQAGRVLIVDLRQPLFNKDDALRFFLVCANQISKVQGRFNKMLVFDEAHEYMSDSFGDRMEARIRLMRHEGTSYVFATQDVSSIPLGINRFLGTRFVFDLGTRENVQDLEQAAPEFRGFQMLGIKPGSCFVQANASTGGMFTRPREIRVRPRVTEHGGGSQIFSGGSRK